MKRGPEMYLLNTFNITKVRMSMNGRMGGGRGGRRGGSATKIPPENAKEIHCHP